MEPKSRASPRRVDDTQIAPRSEAVCREYAPASAIVLKISTSQDPVFCEALSKLRGKAA